MNDPTGKEQLLKLGVRTVPVLARGDQYIFCQNLEDVAEFVGLRAPATPPSPEGLCLGSGPLCCARRNATSGRSLTHT